MATILSIYCIDRTPGRCETAVLAPEWGMFIEGHILKLPGDTKYHIWCTGSEIYMWRENSHSKQTVGLNVHQIFFEIPRSTIKSDSGYIDIIDMGPWLECDLLEEKYLPYCADFRSDCSVTAPVCR